MAYREHDTDSRACWCGPAIYKVCDECDGEGGCWKCDPKHPGLVPAGYDEESPVIIVHNAPEADEEERLEELKRLLRDG